MTKILFKVYYVTIKIKSGLAIVEGHFGSPSGKKKPSNTDRKEIWQIDRKPIKPKRQE